MNPTEVQAAKAAVAAAFARLSPAEKRVAIAKDVIAWLKAGKIKASPGTYLEITKGGEESEGIQKCNACALGAVFACAVERVPTIKLEDAQQYYGSSQDFSDDKMREALSPYFEEEQLLLIENAFEKGTICDPGDEDANERAVDFNKGVRSKRERLERIMKNIIRNGGEFRP